MHLCDAMQNGAQACAGFQIDVSSSDAGLDYADADDATSASAADDRRWVGPSQADPLRRAMVR